MGAEEGVRTAESEGRVASGAFLPDLTATSSLLSSNAVERADLRRAADGVCRGLRQLL